MSNSSSGIEGRKIDGIYTLGTVVYESGNSRIYETEFGDRAYPAVIKLRPADTPDLEQVLARWHEAVSLAHPNLLCVYAAGTTVTDGVDYLYVVEERAEESLAGVLAARPLSESETREVLRQTLAALRYLHRIGYAHSSLKASNILAVGDLVKLSGEDVTRVEEGVTPADDMLALGVLIVECLTQQRIAAGGIPPNMPDAISAPLREIVEHCLDPEPAKRWTADQVEARLNAKEEAPVVPPAAMPAPELLADNSAGTRGTPKWVFGALAALVLIVVLVALTRKKDASPEPGRTVTAAATAPAAPAPEIITRATGSDAPAAKPDKPKSASGTHGRREEGWSVIVASYGSRAAAENRIRKMTQKWPTFKWSVAEEQAGNKRYYLVEIGQKLSEDEAEALRKRALSSGLPRDAYIKKLPHS